MTVALDDDFGTDALTIHHDGKGAIGSATPLTHDGEGLSRLDRFANLDQILRIVAINGFQTIGMSNHHHMAVIGKLA